MDRGINLTDLKVVSKTEENKETVLINGNEEGIHVTSSSFTLMDETHSFSNSVSNPEVVNIHGTETDLTLSAGVSLFHRSSFKAFSSNNGESKPLLLDLERPNGKNPDALDVFEKGTPTPSACSSHTSSSSSSSSSSGSMEDVRRSVHFKPIDDAGWLVPEEEEEEEEYLSMTALTEVMGEEVMEKVRTSLKKRDRTSLSVVGDSVTFNRMSMSPPLRIAEVIHPSPAVMWEQRQKSMKRGQLNKSLIKCGWRVRKALASLKPPENVNTFYMELVNKGEIQDLEGLFSICKVNPSIIFYPDYQDEHERSALRIAIENRNVEVCKVLLKHNVLIRDSIMHAIQRSFVPGLEAILERDCCLDLQIRGENYYFPVGITPMIFGAYCNNYDILKLLYNKGHKLPKAIDWSEGIKSAWESANERRMLCKARCSPAYIVMWVEVYRDDPMEYCINRIREIRKHAQLEQEYSEFYEELERQVENFMCALLDQVRSSEELAMLFQYDHQTFRNRRSAIRAFADASVDRKSIEARLELLDIASQEKLVKFVTHYNSQLSLTYLRYRFAPLLRDMNSWKRSCLRGLIGLLFPILSILYLIAPKTQLGSILTLPAVSFQCHMMSDLLFVLIIFLNVIFRSVTWEYLGAPPNVTECLMLAWILGKWWQEVEECVTRGFRKYLADLWNFSDILQLILFTVAIVLRVVDYAYYGNSTKQIPRSEWSTVEPRLLSEGFLAWAYVLTFLRILSLTRVDRILGPLQISLARMMTNISQFLIIFGLLIISFALGLSQLFWYYGTPEGKLLNCKTNVTNSTTGATNTTTVVDPSCQPLSVSFTTIPQSLYDLFWVLFGALDLNKISLAGKHEFTEIIAKSLVMVYCVSAIIVLINMLIAMMSRSYDEISNNEINEWKFHRTGMWIRFIRREVVRPPPMNLIPNPRSIIHYTRRFWELVTQRCQSVPEPVQKEPIAEPIRRLRPVAQNPSFNRGLKRVGSNLNAGVKRNDSGVHVRKRPASVLTTVKDVISDDLKKQKSKRMMKKLVQRYKHQVFFKTSNADINF